MAAEGPLENNEVEERATEAREVFQSLLDCLVKRVGEAAEIQDEVDSSSDARVWADARATVIENLLNGMLPDSRHVGVAAYASGGNPMNWSKLRRYNAYRTVAAAFGWWLSDEEARRRFGRKDSDDAWNLNRQALRQHLRDRFGGTTDEDGYDSLVNGAQNFFDHVAELERLVKRRNKLSSQTQRKNVRVVSTAPVTVPTVVDSPLRIRALSSLVAGVVVVLSVALTAAWWWFPKILIASIAGEKAVRETEAFNALASDFASQPEARWATVGLRIHERSKVKLRQEDYLRGPTADDIIPWEAGERATPYVSKSLLTQIDGTVWNELARNWYDSVGESFGLTGEYHYVLPFKTYVWAFYYRKSEWANNGYYGVRQKRDGKAEPPSDWEGLVAVAKLMHDKGKIPIAFGNADLWPALGTFDILNMRINGFDFHKSLMEGGKKWTAPEVKDVFVKWRELIPFYRKKEDSTSRPWEATDDKAGTRMLRERTAGMYFIGGYILGDIGNKTDIEDIGVFPFPSIGDRVSPQAAHDANDAVDAPIDGFVLPSKPGIFNLSRRSAAMRFIQYLGTERAFKVYDEHNQGGISVCKGLKPTEYRTEVQRQAAQILSTANGKIARFLDRDTEPGFARQCLTKRLREFLEDQTKIDEVLGSIQRCRDTLAQQSTP